jgi:FAD/FMN-containing dehydrogenase
MDSIRGPGLGSCNDGLVIDISLMRAVRVDPENRTVRSGPGHMQGDMDHSSHAFGLVVPVVPRSFQRAICS